jgi:hypothetical protein
MLARSNPSQNCAKSSSAAIRSGHRPWQTPPAAAPPHRRNQPAEPSLSPSTSRVSESASARQNQGFLGVSHCRRSEGDTSSLIISAGMVRSTKPCQPMNRARPRRLKRKSQHFGRRVSDLCAQGMKLQSRPPRFQKRRKS